MSTTSGRSLDSQHDSSVGLLQSNQGFVDSGMLGHVVQAFLDDAEQSLFLFTAYAGVTVDVQFNHQSIPLF
jgi:hypothetical protein